MKSFKSKESFPAAALSLEFGSGRDVSEECQGGLLVFPLPECVCWQEEEEAGGRQRKTAIQNSGVS